MPRLRTGEKVNRVTRFLLGLRNPRNAAALAAHGFDQDDLDHGWELFRGVVGRKLNVATIAEPDPSVLEQLDAWENKWFPIASASLQYRYPKVHAELFRNLSQTDGPQVVISVDTFLTRIDQLADQGGDGTAARKLLERRGLNRETVAQASALLDRLGKVEDEPEIDLEAIRREQAEAETDMWHWYLEWSTIARQSIHDRAQLRLMGFLRRSPTASAEDEPEDEAVEEEAAQS